jgi:hypothetical protein
MGGVPIYPERNAAAAKAAYEQVILGWEEG